MSKYGHRPHNWFEAIVNKLGGEEAANRFLAGELVVSDPPGAWKTWCKVKLGTGLMTTDDFRKALRRARVKISDRGNEVLNSSNFVVSDKEVEIELIEVTPAELGFRFGAKYEEICFRAEKLGLELCPNEVGPQLHLQHIDLLKHNDFVVAMEAVPVSKGNVAVFFLVHDNCVRCLDGIGGHSCLFWNGTSRFLFIRRNK